MTQSAAPPLPPRFTLDEEAARAWVAWAMTDHDQLIGTGFPGRPGYLTGHCGHAVASSEWAAGLRACERCPQPGAEDAPDRHEMPGIGNRYEPWCYDDEGFDTGSMVDMAQDAGIITGPGAEDRIEFVFGRRDGLSMYQWELTTGDLTLAGVSEPMYSLAYGSKGQDAALVVLAEAVAAANGLLNRLAAWHAAHCPAVTGRPA